MNISRRAYRAFTLAEILVVLAILGILAALLFSALGAARENGRRTVCLSNQKQVLLALQLYFEDSAGGLPVRPDITGPQGEVWIDALLPYTKTPEIFVCPSDLDIDHTREFGFVTSVADGKKHPTKPASYIVTEELLWVSGLLGNASTLHIEAMRLANIVKPSSTVFLSDGVKEASQISPYWKDDTVGDPADGLALSGYILREPSGAHDDGSFHESYAPNPRHNGRINVGFVDGHVKSMATTDWYYPNTPFLDPNRGG